MEDHSIHPILPPHIEVATEKVKQTGFQVRGEDKK